MLSWIHVITDYTLSRDVLQFDLVSCVSKSPYCWELVHFKKCSKSFQSLFASVRSSVRSRLGPPFLENAAVKTAAFFLFDRRNTSDGFLLLSLDGHSLSGVPVSFVYCGSEFKITFYLLSSIALLIFAMWFLVPCAMDSCAPNSFSARRTYDKKFPDLNLIFPFFCVMCSPFAPLIE